MVITSINWDINPITMVIPIIHLEILEQISTDPRKMHCRKGILGRDKLHVRWVVVLFFLMLDFEMFDCFFGGFGGNCFVEVVVIMFVFGLWG